MVLERQRIVEVITGVVASRCHPANSNRAAEIAEAITSALPLSDKLNPGDLKHMDVCRAVFSVGSRTPAFDELREVALRIVEALQAEGTCPIKDAASQYSEMMLAQHYLDDSR
jgi:hypothetical protein